MASALFPSPRTLPMRHHGILKSFVKSSHHDGPRLLSLPSSRVGEARLSMCALLHSDIPEAGGQTFVLHFSGVCRVFRDLLHWTQQQRKCGQGTAFVLPDFRGPNGDIQETDGIWQGWRAAQLNGAQTAGSAHLHRHMWWQVKQDESTDALDQSAKKVSFLSVSYWNCF